MRFSCCIVRDNLLCFWMSALSSCLLSKSIQLGTWACISALKRFTLRLISDFWAASCLKVVAPSQWLQAWFTSWPFISSTEIGTQQPYSPLINTLSEILHLSKRKRICSWIWDIVSPSVDSSSCMIKSKVSKSKTMRSWLRMQKSKTKSSKKPRSASN